MRMPLRKQDRSRYHKMDCYGGARFRDHLHRLGVWPREKFD